MPYIDFSYSESDETNAKNEFILLMQERFGGEADKWDTAWRTVMAAIDWDFGVWGSEQPEMKKAMRETVRKYAPVAPPPSGGTLYADRMREIAKSV